NRDELAAVRKGRFDLHIVDHLRDTLHDLVAAQHLRARLHQLRDAPTIARTLDHKIRDERDRFGMVELHATLETATCDIGCHGDQQLVLLARREVHAMGIPLFSDVSQVIHTRGMARPESTSVARMMSRRTSSGVPRNRAVRILFQALAPQSERASASPVRTASIRSSTPGASAITRPVPRAPAATAGRPRISAMWPSTRTASAKTSRPPRRMRHRSR